MTRLGKLFSIQRFSIEPQFFDRNSARVNNLFRSHDSLRTILGQTIREYASSTNLRVDRE